MIDTHTHLEFPDYIGEVDEVISRAQKAGVEKMLCVGGEPPRNEMDVELAENYPFIFAALGIHPNYANSNSEEHQEWIANTLSQKKIVAVGEIGLDYHYNYALYDTQKSVFNNYLAIAKDVGKPVIIHSREAFSDTFEILKKYAPLTGVVHCFSYSLAEAEAFLSLGLHISFCGQITFKKCDELRDVAKEIPLDKLLLETDCPFLTPAPHRGKRNEPAFVKFIAEKHAEIRGIPFDEIDKITTENAIKLFNLKS